jgi:hypothetical protein
VFILYGVFILYRVFILHRNHCSIAVSFSHNIEFVWRNGVEQLGEASRPRFRHTKCVYGMSEEKNQSAQALLTMVIADNTPEV